MKKFALFAFTAALASGATAETLYYWAQEMNSSGAWKLDPEFNVEAGRAPTAADDVILGRQQTGNWQPMGGDLTVKSFTIADTNGGWINILGQDKTLNVVEDFAINHANIIQIGYNNMPQGGMPAADGDGFRQIIVGGNFEVKSAVSELKTVFKNTNTYDISNPSMIIGGVAKFTNSDDAATYRWAVNAFVNRTIPDSEKTPATSVIQLGGLETTGNKTVMVCNNDQGAFTTLSFKSDGKTAFTGGDAKITLNDFYGLFNDRSYINVVMDGGADGGRQILRVMSTAPGWDASNHHSVVGRSSVSVKSGSLDLFSEEKFLSADVSGGKFGIAGSSAANDKKGSLLTQTLNLNGGEIWFDVGDVPDNGDIIYADSIGGDLSTVLVLNLNEDFFSIGDILDGAEFAVFRGVTGFDDWGSLAVEAYFNGVRQDIAYSWNDGVITIDSGTVVPEPAAVAAVFGVLALAFAAYRRRK